jgi:hypothetical protein
MVTLPRMKKRAVTTITKTNITSTKARAAKIRHRD